MEVKIGSGRDGQERWIEKRDFITSPPSSPRQVPGFLSSFYASRVFQRLWTNVSGHENLIEIKTYINICIISYQINVASLTMNHPPSSAPLEQGGDMRFFGVGMEAFLGRWGCAVRCGWEVRRHGIQMKYRVTRQVGLELWNILGMLATTSATYPTHPNNPLTKL